MEMIELVDESFEESFQLFLVDYFVVVLVCDDEKILDFFFRKEFACILFEHAAEVIHVQKTFLKVVEILEVFLHHISQSCLQGIIEALVGSFLRQARLPYFVGHFVHPLIEPFVSLFRHRGRKFRRLFIHFQNY
jgi:hypothetical protein